MSSIYTKTGDLGETSLYGGSRVRKNSNKVWAYGTLDEAISTMGVAYSFCKDKRVKSIINKVQQELFNVSAEIASDHKGREKLSIKIDSSHVTFLESIIDEFNEEIGAITSFVVPGINNSSSFLHMCRTVVRRAERHLVDLCEEEIIRDVLPKYINRLSDLLYMMARIEEQEYVIGEVKSRVLNELEKNHELKGDMRVNSNKLHLGRIMAQTAIEKARQMGINIVFSMVDSHGNLVLLERMDNSLLASIDICINKAFSSSALKLSTDKIGQLCKEDGELYGIQWTNNNRIVPFGGGYPLMVGDECIGAIGISGGTVEEDMIIGSHALRVFELEKNR